MNYDVFLDESGLFRESSSKIEEQESNAKGDGRKFPSQIAGVVCREGVITSGNAHSILKSACAAGGIEYEARFHASEHRGRAGFDAMVESFCASLKSKGVRLARLVNAEQVSFGDRIATYCNVLAELLVRICRQLETNGEPQVTLNVYAAKVVKSDDEKTGIEFIHKDDYIARIQELFARVAVANGFNSSRFRWKVQGFQIRSAREDRRLQLADVVSYSSHDDFWPLRDHENANAILRSALAAFDWTFSCDDTLTQVLDFLNRESYATALIALAERATTEGIAKEAVSLYEAMASRVVLALEELPPATQKPQFQMIAGWLNQVAEQRKDLDSSVRCCRWMRKVLCERQACKNWPADWLRLVTDTWALTACNHDANTVLGRTFADQIEVTIPKLTSRWEYADDLMFSLIVKAVHQNDCFEHRTAADRMASVVGYYESLDGFFADAFKGLFPEKVLSDLRARALGTQLQSEIGLLLTSEGNLSHCREISDQAISEFQHQGDRSRQLQYRCELETIAGDWATARRYLARSLDLSDESHSAIANCLAEIPDHFGKAFSLLHWSRIGSMSAVAGDPAEAAAFLSALHHAKLHYTPWCSGEPCVGAVAVYPAHGILRHLAVATACGRDVKTTVGLLRNLGRVVVAKPRPLFQMIQIAAHLQSAALLAEAHSRSADLIFGDKNKPGAKEMIEVLSAQIEGSHPVFSEILGRWRCELESEAKTGLDRNKLICMGRIVGY